MKRKKLNSKSFQFQEKATTQNSDEMEKVSRIFFPTEFDFYEKKPEKVFFESKYSSPIFFPDHNKEFDGTVRFIFNDFRTNSLKGVEASLFSSIFRKK